MCFICHYLYDRLYSKYSINKHFWSTFCVPGKGHHSERGPCHHFIKLEFAVVNQSSDFPRGHVVWLGLLVSRYYFLLGFTREFCLFLFHCLFPPFSRTGPRPSVSYVVIRGARHLEAQEKVAQHTPI